MPHWPGAQYIAVPRGEALLDTASGQRVLATTTDPLLIARMESSKCVEAAPQVAGALRR